MPRALRPFEYIEAGSVEEAAGILSTWGEVRFTDLQQGRTI